MVDRVAKLSGRNRRLQREQEIIESRFSGCEDIEYQITRLNQQGMAVEYLFIFNIRSFAGVDEEQRPFFAERFVMEMLIPEGFPCIDAPAELRFLCFDRDSGEAIAHPWHPNIRYFGAFAGRVCLNKMDSFTELAWSIDRVVKYLRYERYHALEQPPYPEDLTVAKWVREYEERINDLRGY